MQNNKVKELKVKELMKEKVWALSPETPISDAIDEIISKEITGMPVIDNDGYLIGYLAIKDIIREALPPIPNSVVRHLFYNNSEKLVENLSPIGKCKVKEIMTDPLYITDETSFGEAIEFFLDKKISQVSVVDGKMKLVGLLRQDSILTVLREFIIVAE